MKPPARIPESALANLLSLRRTARVIAKAAASAAALVALGGCDFSGLLGSSPGTARGNSLVPHSVSTSDNCMSLRTGSEWLKTVELSASGLGFSGTGDPAVINDPAPGSGGVFITIQCFPLSNVGPADVVDLPNSTLLQRESITLAGAPGYLLAYSYRNGAGVPDSVTLEVSVDKAGLRCSLRAVGDSAAMTAIRPTLDESIRTIGCGGS